MVVKFYLKKVKDGQFYFNLYVVNGEIIFISELYKVKDLVFGGIELVCKNFQCDGVFEVKLVSNGKFYFVFKVINGQVVGQSQFYVSQVNVEVGVQLVKCVVLEVGFSDES